MRARRTALVAAAILVLTAGALVVARLHAAPIVLENVTPSMPLGLYRRTDRPVTEGAVVAVKQPSSARAYLKSLGFPADALLLKRVAVGIDQVVCASADRVTAGKLDLPRIDRDSLGTLLPKWTGCFRLASSDVFLRGDDARSFDSRYFGPVPRSDIIGVYERLP